MSALKADGDARSFSAWVDGAALVLGQRLEGIGHGDELVGGRILLRELGRHRRSVGGGAWDGQGAVDQHRIVLRLAGRRKPPAGLPNASPMACVAIAPVLRLLLRLGAGAGWAGACWVSARLRSRPAPASLWSLARARVACNPPVTLAVPHRHNPRPRSASRQRRRSASHCPVRSRRGVASLLHSGTIAPWQPPGAAFFAAALPSSRTTLPGK